MGGVDMVWPASLALPLVLCGLILLSGLGLAAAAVHSYSGTFDHVVDAWMFMGGREGVFASRVDEPGPGWQWWTYAAVNNGRSYIRFKDIQFEPGLSEDIAASVGSTVQAVLFEAKDYDLIGYQDENEKGFMSMRSVCCNWGLSQVLGCTPGSLIWKPRNGSSHADWPRVLEFQVTASDGADVNNEQSVFITETGMYYLWFVSCSGDVRLEGSTVWKNPSGFLPGMLIPILPFFKIMAALYGALCIAWFVTSIVRWRQGRMLRSCVGAILLLTLVEITLWCCTYTVYNKKGDLPSIVALTAEIISSARKALQHVLLVALALGWPTCIAPVPENLPGPIATLATIYFLAEAFMSDLVALDDSLSLLGVYWVFPVVLLDVIFLSLTASALRRTLLRLRMERKFGELARYEHFSVVLVSAFFASLVWSAYSMYYHVLDFYGDQWQRDWVTAAFWYILVLYIQASICCLWANLDSDEGSNPGELAGATVSRAGASASPAQTMDAATAPLVRHNRTNSDRVIPDEEMPFSPRRVVASPAQSADAATALRACHSRTNSGRVITDEEVPLTPLPMSRIWPSGGTTAAPARLAAEEHVASSPRQVSRFSGEVPAAMRSNLSGRYMALQVEHQ
eukprot:jgi/Chlat1/104/Chrsp1S03211